MRLPKHTPFDGCCSRPAGDPVHIQGGRWVDLNQIIDNYDNEAECRRNNHAIKVRRAECDRRKARADKRKERDKERARAKVKAHTEIALLTQWVQAAMRSNGGHYGGTMLLMEPGGRHRWHTPKYGEPSPVMWEEADSGFVEPNELLHLLDSLNLTREELSMPIRRWTQYSPFKVARGTFYVYLEEGVRYFDDCRAE